MPSSACQTCALDRKSTRLNSSHTIISYAVFCLQKKKQGHRGQPHAQSRQGRQVAPIACRPPTWRASRAHTLSPSRRGLGRHAPCCFFFNDTATTEIYTLSLHDALPICCGRPSPARGWGPCRTARGSAAVLDRKSTRLNSSHTIISYAVFCLKKKTK